MIWDIDNATQNAANVWIIQIENKEPVQQFQGRQFNILNWNDRVLAPINWPVVPFASSPQNIIDEFQNHHYLEGLALVASWGTMWRHPNSIWGHRPLQNIRNALHQCALSIQKTNSINQSWDILTGHGAGQLGWSAVITSKTLHFLTRSLGIIEDPPVAIDNKIIRNNVWPYFVEQLGENNNIYSWNGNTLAAYLRYMTAILTWANHFQWSTTEMETTIFSEYGNQ